MLRVYFSKLLCTFDGRCRSLEIAPLEQVGFPEIKLLRRRPLHPSPLAPAPAQASALSSAQVHFALEMPSSAQASAQCSMIRVHRTVYLPGPGPSAIELELEIPGPKCTRT